MKKLQTLSTPQQFLLTELPTLLTRATLTHSQPMTLQVLVPGHKELRTHYALSAKATTSGQGLLASEPDVSLSIGLPELEALQRGALNWSEAVGLGRVQVFGEAGAAERLAQLFEGAAS